MANTQESVLRGVVVGNSQFTTFELQLLVFALSFAVDHTGRQDLRMKYMKLRDRIQTLVDAHPAREPYAMLDELSEVVDG